MDDGVWQSASGRFAAADEERGKWELDTHLPENWVLQFDGLKFEAMPTPFRHLGFFPEQSPHWRWTQTAIHRFIKRYKKAPRLLNLFAYSGVASLHAAQAGAEVTHLDASKKAVAQAFRTEIYLAWQTRLFVLSPMMRCGLLQEKSAASENMMVFCLIRQNMGAGPKVRCGS